MDSNTCSSGRCRRNSGKSNSKEYAVEVKFFKEVDPEAEVRMTCTSALLSAKRN